MINNSNPQVPPSIRFYKRINAPIDHPPILCRPDTPCIPSPPPPTILEDLKKQYQSHSQSSLKKTKLKSLQTHYKEQIRRLQSKLQEQQKSKRRTSDPNHLSGKQLSRVMLLSLEVERMRNWISRSEEVIVGKEEEICTLKLSQKQELEGVRGELVRKAAKELEEVKVGFERVVKEMKEKQVEYILEMKRSESKLRIEEVGRRGEMEVMGIEMARVARENQVLRESSQQLQKEIKLLKDKLSQSLIEANIANNQLNSKNTPVIDAAPPTQISQISHQLSAQLKQLQTSNTKKTAEILRLLKHTQLLQQELKIHKQLLKLQPCSDRKQEFRRGDQSLEISLENSNLNQKEKLRIEELIRECRSEIRIKDEEIESLTHQLEHKENELVAAERLIQFKDKKIKELGDAGDEELLGQVQELRDKILENENKIELLEGELERRGGAMKQLRQELEGKQKELGEKGSLLQEREQKYKELQETYSVLNDMFEHQVRRNGQALSDA